MHYYKQIRKSIENRNIRFLILYSAMVAMAILGLVFVEWTYVALWVLLASVLSWDASNTNSYIERMLNDWTMDVD